MCYQKHKYYNKEKGNYEIPNSNKQKWKMKMEKQIYEKWTKSVLSEMAVEFKVIDKMKNKTKCTRKSKIEQKH